MSFQGWGVRDRGLLTKACRSVSPKTHPHSLTPPPPPSLSFSLAFQTNPSVFSTMPLGQVYFSLHRRNRFSSSVSHHLSLGCSLGLFQGRTCGLQRGQLRLLLHKYRKGEYLNCKLSFQLQELWLI